METRTVDTAKEARSDEFAAVAPAETKTRNVDPEKTRDLDVDAVRVDLSASIVRRAVAKGAEEDRERAEDDESGNSKVTGINPEEMRERFENAINSTEVRFDVSIKDSGKSSLFFQVVEKESGKVIRQFPHEELVELARQQAEKAEHVGHLIRALA